MSELRFTVPGTLPGWQRTGGSGKVRFTQEQTRAAEMEVAAWGRQAAAGRLLSGAVRLTVVSYRAMPPSWGAAKRAKMAGQPATSKPDWDNLGKLVGDALNGVCYGDDAQIADARVVKVWAERGRTEVRLWQIGDGWSVCKDV